VDQQVLKVLKVLLVLRVLKVIRVMMETLVEQPLIILMIPLQTIQIQALVI
jgi:hypothetical protein